LKNVLDIWWGQHFRTNTYGPTDDWKRLALSNGPKVWYLYPHPTLADKRIGVRSSNMMWNFNTLIAIF